MSSPKKTISFNDFIKNPELFRSQDESICIVGGCFDVIHPGHIIFLQKAKKEADVLVVLLESDERIKILKGEKRPVHTQKERALILSELESVDFILLLPTLKNDSDYDKIITTIKPEVIAITAGDIGIEHKERVASLSGAKLKKVTKFIGNYSTTNILSKK